MRYKPSDIDIDQPPMHLLPMGVLRCLIVISILSHGSTPRTHL
jgi:hypothetical protein